LLISIFSKIVKKLFLSDVKGIEIKLSEENSNNQNSQFKEFIISEIVSFHLLNLSSSSQSLASIESELSIQKTIS
jgi:hypothetical protein